MMRHYQLLHTAIVATFVLVLLAGLGSVGVTWDDPIHRLYGELNLASLHSGDDTEVLHYANMYLYGSLFDLLTAWLNATLHAGDGWLLRHVCSVLFGALAVSYAMRTARLLYGELIALIAGLLLVATPQFTGHALFNHKDIPFAALYVASTFYLLRLIEAWPDNPPWRTWLAFGVAVGAALSIRVGALLIWAYGAIGLGFVLLAHRRAKRPLKPVVHHMTAGILLSSFIAYGITWLCWPFLRHAFIPRLLRVLRENSMFPWEGSILYWGEVIPVDRAGAGYLPSWLYAISPPLLLAGLCLVPFAVRRVPQPWSRPHLLSLMRQLFIASVLFPPFYGVLKHVRLYDSLRQLLFLFPGLCVLAALGLFGAYQLMQRSRSRAIALGAAALLWWQPVAWMIGHHPFAYTYFTPLLGGLQGASRLFDTDYWGLSARNAAEWLNAQPGEHLKIYIETPWETMTPYLEPLSRYEQVTAREDANLEVLTYRNKFPGWERRPADYWFSIEPGQIPFFVARKVTPRPTPASAPVTP